MLVLDSDQFSPRDGADAWAGFAARKLSAVRCVPAGDHRFQVNPLRGIQSDYVASVYAQADRRSSYPAVFDTACRIIARKAHDPDFHPATLARQLGISIRMLQRIFQKNGATVAQWIVRTRLDKGSIMLGDERMRACTITDIAFACGFRDLTTFERAFSAVKGMTPSAWRRSAANGPV